MTLMFYFDYLQNKWTLYQISLHELKKTGFDKFKGADIKFKPKKYLNKAFLVPNSGIIILSQDFVIKQLRRH